MKKQPHLTKLLVTASLALGGAQLASAGILDDFNVNAGHFNNNTYNSSGTSAGLATTSSSTQITTNSPIEGSGHMRIVVIYSGTGSPRWRYLSGGGTPANNVNIPVTDGVDGFIGYYLRTTNANWVTQVNFDGPGGGIAGMDSSLETQVIPDGEWHLYEWSLDSSDWGPVPGIGGGHGGTLLTGNHTIDSLYFRYVGDTSDSNAVNSVLYLDFVAFNPAGSVSNLITVPCLATSGVLVDGPVAANSSQVKVLGVATNATSVKVYQQTGAGTAVVGSKTSGITGGTTLVDVTGLIKNALVKATQVVSNTESCLPSDGVFVGSGANPPVRMAVSIRETTSTGPIGAPAGDLSSGNIHFLGGTALSGGAPIDAPVVYPSNGWQTVTFDRGTFQSVGESANVVGTPVPGSGFFSFETASLEVYAFKVIPQNGTVVFSTNPVISTDVSSNDSFNIQWTWSAVPGATGYRIIRNHQFNGFTEYLDVTSNSFTDTNGGWIYVDLSTNSIAVTPVYAQSGRSVKWNAPTGDPNPIGTTNNIPGDWGILESLNFCIYNADTGPFDFYVDSVQNGSTVFQNWDTNSAGATDVGFRTPRFSGSTDTGLLTAPDVGQVSNATSDTPTNSFRISYQWNGTNVSKWVRLTTSGVGNPMVDLNQPISFKLLMLPTGTFLPPGKITATQSGTDIVLNWTGSYYLQSATTVDGTYTDVSANRLTSPYTTSATTGTKFFRLRN